MKCILNKFPAIVAFGLTLSATMSVPAFAEPIDTSISVEQSEKAAINWTQGSDSFVTSVGIGLPGGKGVAMARVAAMMDAQRNLLGILKGVQIDSETLMQDLMIQSDTVKRNINGLLQGAQIVEEYANPDGSYFMRMSVPLYGATGSVASAVLPEVTRNIVPEPLPTAAQTVLPREERSAVQSANYTGVVVDASGLGLSPTFSPIIYDVNGRAVYGIQNIDSQIAIAKGMVGYADALSGATSGSRAGINPLVVTAVEVRGGKNSSNPVNVVVSVEDADRILIANEKGAFLSNGAVIFVK